MFFCNISPSAGGETPLADSRKILSLLKKATVDKFASKNVMYKRTLGGTGLGLSWQEAFQTTDKNLIKQICDASDMRYTWDGDLLKLSWVRPALQTHPVTGERVWFNHAFFYHRSVAYDESILEVLSDDELPFRSFYGDGSEIELSVIDEIRQAYNQTNVEFAWRKGDLLLVDNLLVAHGRNAFKGPRQILVAIFNSH
jgi:alpha-ketoglutarate-dependent taurine dioxygenase